MVEEIYPQDGATGETTQKPVKGCTRESKIEMVLTND